MDISEHHGRLSALFAAQRGLITSRQGETDGLTRRRVRRLISIGAVDEPAPGVLRLTAVPPSWEQGLLIATLAGHGRAVISHRAAAGLHHLDGFEAGPVEASVARPAHLRLPGVIGHEVHALAPRDVTVIDGIAVTGLARTLCDLGSVVPPDRVEQALDDARRRGTSLRWLRQTAQRLRRPGQAGTKVLLDLLEQVEQGGTVRGSWFEKLVEDCLRCPDLPPLKRQHVLRDARGRFVAVIDVALPSLRLGVEAHSRQFHFGRAAEARDEDRDHRLSRAGWEVLYVGWQGTKQPARLLDLVLDVAGQRRRLLEPRSRPEVHRE